MSFANDFFSNKRMPKIEMTSFIALLPKATNPQCLRDFRPICLVGSLYLIVSKLLFNRVKKLVGKVDFFSTFFFCSR